MLLGIGLFFPGCSWGEDARPFGLAVPVQSTASRNCQASTFRVALDIGHDRSRPGATSARGFTEYSYNLALGELVLRTLRDHGFVGAFLIGESGSPMQLARRPEIARDANAALFISLHHDSVQRRYFSTWQYEGRALPYSDTFHGYSIFVSASSPLAKQSLALAIDLAHAAKAQGLTPSLHHAEPIPGEGRQLLDSELGIYEFGQLAVLRGATMPALLLESGIIVNRDEEWQIRSGPYRSKVAAALLSAITKFCAHTARP